MEINKHTPCGIVVLGIVVGAVLGGVLLCTVIEIAAGREQQAMQQEIKRRTAVGDENAEERVVMEHHTMPIAAAMGFFIELGVVAGLCGTFGGVVASAIWRRMHRQPSAQ